MTAGKTALEHSHAIHLLGICGRSPTPMAELRCWDRDRLSHKDKNIYYLALYRSLRPVLQMIFVSLYQLRRPVLPFSFVGLFVCLAGFCSVEGNKSYQEEAVTGSRFLTAHLAALDGSCVMWTFGKEEGILVCITDGFKQLLEFLLITTLRQEVHDRLWHFCDNHVIRSRIAESFQVYLLVGPIKHV